MKICFFGSSLVSSYWNGAATYYRGMLKQIAALGHDITFFEPDAFERQAHRDIADPDWARVVVYPATSDGWRGSLDAAARSADMLIKASGVGVFDEELEIAVAALPARTLRIYWDVDAPATLEAMANDPSHHLRGAIPSYDMVLTYGGGDGVVSAYRAMGVRDCVPIYNALDPETHFPFPPRPNFACDLSLLANRLPDREQRVEHFFLDVALALPDKSFLLGGSGWETKDTASNLRKIGHVGTGEHNAFFGSGLATLNVNRDSMARYGFSPPTRVFEAIGAGACLITDQWPGIDHFLEPDREVLVAASGAEVAGHLSALCADRAAAIANRARARVLSQHTYWHRARQFNQLFVGSSSRIEAAE
ncbi:MULTISPECIES: glycosyltransferase [unclassified Bradyrhizobium]|uniref:CgeB family protein n=1 Tax=unclassified Bradyrhizobium TaxID=2631580 RepID=UPI0015C948D6|nr:MULTISPECIES: glycosyltransferase [unclassified Bradyrhizobium]MBB4256059.1 spore maturation protein CgeB [Bradyrhizobium sp. CIR3A]MBB4392433.1 spore maturation protein CgeB [Bradyrhizobium sp. ERR14]NYG48227.1 spore maturation protein CgeB [Bradyrhizobium sp. IAR9]